MGDGGWGRGRQAQFGQGTSRGALREDQAPGKLRTGKLGRESRTGNLGWITAGLPGDPASNRNERREKKSRIRALQAAFLVSWPRWPDRQARTIPLCEAALYEAAFPLHAITLLNNGLSAMGFRQWAFGNGLSGYSHRSGPPPGAFNTAGCSARRPARSAAMTGALSGRAPPCQR